MSSIVKVNDLNQEGDAPVNSVCRNGYLDPFGTEERKITKLDADQAKKSGNVCTNNIFYVCFYLLYLS